MKSSDPASLQNLNDIVLPATIDWWPLASGWYVLIGFLSIGLGFFAYRALQSWVANRYRREALVKLQAIREDVQSPDDRHASLRTLPVLLKRTALSAYPRSQVASLSGQDWFAFLNSTLKMPAFSEAVSINLESISYSSGDLSKLDSQASAALIDASLYWIKHHQTAVRSKDTGVT